MTRHVPKLDTTRPRTPPNMMASKDTGFGAASKSMSPNFVDQPAYVRNNIDQLIGRMFITSGMTVCALP